MLDIGQFVKTLQKNSLGIGKIEKINKETVQVSFFDSPVTPDIIREVPITQISATKIPKQTRVYWQDSSNASWTVGRVIQSDSDGVEVRFPNKKDYYLPNDEVFVRWHNAIQDPSNYLANKINETPLFSEARSKFYSAIIEQRAACQNMTALISSIIELEPHQVEVIRRVLQDPVQKYLLADEVGLGKTIEAGVVIRQYVIDEPISHKIVILTPKSLVSQWRDELKVRFLLDAHLDETVHIVSTEESINYLQSLLSDAGMVVIDEAHHLSQDRNLYDSLKQIISRSPRLLLLSATPVLHNEQNFLEMLHLLDPIVYPLDQVNQFKEKISHRQMLAECVAGLIPENIFQLDTFLDDLQENFNADNLLEQYVESLREILDLFPEENEPNFLKALHDLRAHLSEIYRLDRRILRNRRNAIFGLTPKREGVSYVKYQSIPMNTLILSLESWRNYISAEIYGIEDTSDNKELSKWYFDLINELLTDQNQFHYFISEKIAYLEKNNAVSTELNYLRELIKLSQEYSYDKERYLIISNILEQERNGRNKFIIFCSSSYVADNLADYLRDRNIGIIDRHEEISEDDEKPSWMQFLDSPDHRVLVCDSNAEEGLNLQGGEKVIIHFDIPLSPNRIEQRMGRVDRFGSGDPIHSFVIQCTDNPYEKEWSSCLDQGFGVYNQSIASLQYLIDSEMKKIADDFLINGIETI